MTATVDDVRNAIRTRMAVLGWANVDLARAADIDPGTVGDFLNGKVNWPQRPKRTAMEKALGWEMGTMDAMRHGGAVVPDEESLAGVLLDLPEEAYSDLAPAEREEAISAAKAAFMQRAREIRGRP